MEVSHDHEALGQYLLGRPSVTVEDPHAVANHAFGRSDAHLPRKVGNDARVVVPEDELHAESAVEERGEKVEDDGSEWTGGPDDRMLRVPGDDHPVGAGRPCRLDEAVRKIGRIPFRGPPRTSGYGAEAEVEVGDDQGPRAPRAAEQERRLARDGGRPGAFHGE